MSNKRKGKEFPNRWRVLVNAPDEYFHPLPFVDILEKNWELRPGTLAIIRAESFSNGKIKEFAYKQEKSCHDKIQSLLDTHEMTIMTDEFIGCINYDPTTD
jgi:hypothetical protein